MVDFPVLSLMTFLPLLGAALIALVRGEEGAVARNARFAALYASGFVFLLSLYMLAHFDPANAGFQFVENKNWLPGMRISYHMGVDGISVFFVVLSALLTPLCILASWTSITTRVKEYMIAFLLLETFMIGSFCALNTILFYVFFEGVLIPMFLIIGVWGGKRRVYSAFKFFLYTLLGSVLMLLAILWLYFHAGSDITTLPEQVKDLPLYTQELLWLAFFASFAVKMPMWPVHTWLPDAHVEAPTAGSVILAGVLLKMGGYGFLRFSLPLLPAASAHFAPLVFGLSIIAIIYTSLVALVQEDIKKLIAYSSVAHMGFVTMGIFSATQQGIDGAMFQMLSHGIISAALFLCVGVIYDRLHTREIARYGGLVNNMPKYAVLLMVFTLGSVGLPGTTGFVGEFLSLLGAFRVSTATAAFAATGVVLGAAYMLVMYRRVVFGTQVNKDAAALPDINLREIFILAPLALMVVALGVLPGYVLNRIGPADAHVLALYNASSASNEPLAATRHKEIQSHSRKRRRHHD